MSMRVPLRVALFAAAFSLTLAAGSHAQAVRQDSNGADSSANDPVKPVTPADYGQFERMGRATLSPDGRWLAVPIIRVNEENELRIHRTDIDSVVVIPYGSITRFSGDSRWVAYQIGMSKKDRKALEKQDKPLQQRVGLLNLATGDTSSVDAVTGYQFSHSGRYLAMWL